MNAAMKRSSRLLLEVVVFGFLAISASAQDPPPMTLQDAINGYESVTNGPAGVPDDWTHHHLVFSMPALGTPIYDQVVKDPRFWLQQIKRLRPEPATNVKLIPRLMEGFADPTDAKLSRPKKSRAKLKTDWSEDLGSGAKVGANMYPAKFSFSVSGTPNCTSDYVAYSTGLAGSATQASIVAFNNLYVGASPGCGTSSVPTIDWAYNTGGTIVTAPVLSADGTQLAFVHTPSSLSSASTLVLLKWAAGTGTITNPATPTSVSNSNYRACTPPCMTTITFASNPGDPANDPTSAPYYDYTNDVIYSGDYGFPNGGVGADPYLHKFTGVFNGTPAEVTTSPWPVMTDQQGPVTSPVYDSVSGLIYFGCSHGNVAAVGASSGTVTVSGPLGSAPDDVADAPLVDPTAARVYVVVADDYTGLGNAGLFQFTDPLSGGSQGTEETIGKANHGAGAGLYAGTFDNHYYTSSTPSSPSGNLYVCGDPGGDANLYDIPISGNTMGTASPLNTALSTASVQCSPVTEIYNGTTDLAFLSVPNDANGTQCSNGSGGGCIMSFALPSTGSLSTTATSSANAAETGGTSGIIVDNISTQTGASNVYFSTLSNGACATSGGTGGCAVQAAQNGL
jgi:hypothetical protein